MHRIRFVNEACTGQQVFLTFADPVPQQAICVVAGTGSLENLPRAVVGDGIDIRTSEDHQSEHLAQTSELMRWVGQADVPGSAPPVVITIHGANVIWGGSRAAIQAAPERLSQFLSAVVDFSYYETELRKLERELAASWPSIEQDRPVAYQVSEADPERFEEIGKRMDQALQRRIRLARIVPHLHQPRPQLLPLANQLVDRLREKTHVEHRHEALASQLDVCDRMYEMISQRISDHKSAQKSHALEWVIIVLLATETLLLLADLLWNMGV